MRRASSRAPKPQQPVLAVAAFKGPPPCLAVPWTNAPSTRKVSVPCDIFAVPTTVFNVDQHSKFLCVYGGAQVCHPHRFFAFVPLV